MSESNILRECAPKIFAMLHPSKNVEDKIDVDTLTIGSHKKVWWQCLNSSEHFWRGPVNQVYRGGGCAMCRGLYIVHGINDLSVVRPDIYRQLNVDLNVAEGIDGKILAPSSNKKVWWKCDKNNSHYWNASVNSRVSGNGCGMCKSAYIIHGVNDLSISQPELYRQLNTEMNAQFEIDTSTLSDWTSRKVWWKCGKNGTHYWKASVNLRSRGNGCAMCSGHYIIHGINDLSVTNPLLYRKLHLTMNHDAGLDTTRLAYSTATKLWWKCDKNSAHYWRDSVAHRADDRGCAMCAGYYVIQGINDLSATYPSLYAQLHPTMNVIANFKTLYSGSKKKVWWLGLCGHHWEAQIVSRVCGNGCPYCANKAVLPGFNDLYTTNFELAKEWNYLKNSPFTPGDFTCGSSIKVWWICSKQHEWQSTVSNRNRGNGCPQCAETQTSKIQQAFHKALSAVIPDLICDTRLPISFSKRKSMSVDMFSAGLNVGIEYDGKYYHSGQRSGKPIQWHLDHDRDKTQALLDAGYRVVRIRENGLAHLGMNTDKVLELDYQYGDSMVNILGEIETWIKK